MKPIFFFLIILTFLGANVYVFYRLVYMLPPVLMWRAAVIVLGALAVLSLFGSFLAGNTLPSGVISLMYTVGTAWFFISLYFLLTFLLLDIVRVTNLLPVSKILHNNPIAFVVITGLIALIFFGGYLKYQRKERVELNISTHKGAGGNLLKIVAVSDLHLGYTIGKKEFAGWVELINKENPDVVLLAGDVIDNSLRPLNEQGMAEVFRRINSRYGVYTILGNHEYISGEQNSLAFFEEAGVTVLRDSHELIADRFYVVGRDDFSNTERKSVNELTASLDKTKPVILLDHQPYYLEEASLQGIDLQISGHTHYGQLWPFSWITRAIYEIPHGYLKKGNSHFYVSSGLGIWGGKFRIGTQSEYVVINLESSLSDVDM